MKDVHSVPFWFSILILCAVSQSEANQSRSQQCDMSGDNCEKFSFGRFQANATKVNGTQTRKIGDSLKAVDVDAFNSSIAIQEDGKLTIRNRFLWLEKKVEE